MGRRFNTENYRNFKIGDRVLTAWDRDQEVKGTVVQTGVEYFTVRFDKAVAPTEGGQFRTEWRFHWTCIELLNALERLSEI